MSIKRTYVNTYTFISIIIIVIAWRLFWFDMAKVTIRETYVMSIDRHGYSRERFKASCRSHWRTIFLLRPRPKGHEGYFHCSCHCSVVTFRFVRRCQCWWCRRSHWVVVVISRFWIGLLRFAEEEASKKRRGSSNWEICPSQVESSSLIHALCIERHLPSKANPLQGRAATLPSLFHTMVHSMQWIPSNRTWEWSIFGMNPRPFVFLPPHAHESIPKKNSEGLSPMQKYLCRRSIIHPLCSGNGGPRTNVGQCNSGSLFVD